jgi:hypothetical protein
MEFGLGQAMPPAGTGQAAQMPVTAPAQHPTYDEVRLPNTHASQQAVEPPRALPPQPIARQNAAMEPLPDLPTVIEPALHADNVPLPLTHPAHPSNQPATSTIDPNIPSNQSAPTALPTNASTSPHEQRMAMRNEHPAVINREIEKTKAEERDLKGEKPKGTVVSGIEDDRLWAMLRRFDVVSPVPKTRGNS